MKLSRNSRCLTIALVFSLLFVLFFAQAAFASEVRLSASKETGFVGDIVTVKVSIANALDTEGGQFDLSYGPTLAGGSLMLEAVAIRNGDFVPDFSSNNYNLNVGDNKLRVLWVTAAGSSKESGVLCYIDFKITGEGETELKFSEVIILESAVQTTSGSISGKGGLDDKDIHIQKAEDAINAIPVVIDCNNTTHRTLVTTARATVETVMRDHGVKTSDISNYSKLTDAEKAIAKCDAIRAAEVAIDDLPEVDKLTLPDKSKVENARRLVELAKSQYGATNEDFRNYSRLVAAENKIKELEGLKPTPPTGGASIYLMGGLLLLVSGAVILKRRQLLVQ